MTFFDHSFSDRLLLLTLALLLNALFGGPAWLHTLLHLNLPTLAIRNATATLVQRMNRRHRSTATRQARGVLLTLGYLGLAFVFGLALSKIAAAHRIGALFEILVLATLLRARQGLELAQRVRKLLAAQQLADAINELQPYTARQLEGEESYAVARASIEAANHRLVSGTLSPSFWYLAGGMPFAVMAGGVHLLAYYAARPTADKAAFAGPIRLADLFFRTIPERLAMLFVLLLSPLVPGGKVPAPAAVFRVKREDRIADFRLLQLVAQAFGLALGGPGRIDGEYVTLPWIGEGVARIGGQELLRAQLLYAYAIGAWLLLLAILTLFTTY